MAGDEGVMPHLRLAGGERRERATAMGFRCRGLAHKQPIKQTNKTELKSWTWDGRKQQVETEHEAGQDLGCKTADWGGHRQTGIDAHVGKRQKGNDTGSERWGREETVTLA